ncbi:MAG: molybdenum cofactor guanylyltransferase [Anaerolineales bacterium]|nr:molybdenum cofactor guanylyltransferase [Anaerolineales bacterium]
MLTLALQAGGQSSRMGEDKALKLFLGRPLIQRAIERLAPIADEILITTNRPCEYEFLNTRLVPDLITGRGPLGGLYTAIASATRPLVAVAACDLPFASPLFFESAHRLMVETEADVVIAKTTAGYEPFHALYRRAACLPLIQAALAEDVWRVSAWLSNAKLRIFSPAEMRAIDPSGLCFWNVNTPAEFLEAEQIASGRSTPDRAHGKPPFG